MTLKLQAIEQRLITLLAYHQKLVAENRNGKRMHFVARHIRRLTAIYENGTSKLNTQGVA